MKQFTTHGATHFQRKACVKDAMQQQAPPTVISFVGNEADFKKDCQRISFLIFDLDADLYTSEFEDVRKNGRRIHRFIQK